MSEFIIHTVPGSPYGRSVLMVLEEKHTPYRILPVMPGKLKTPEHLARHPFGRVPVMEHGDYCLYECQAIMRYLDRVLPLPTLTPAEPRTAGRMDQLMNINDWYLFQGVANVIVFQRIVGPRVMGLHPDEDLIRSVMPKGRVVFDQMSHILSDREFFAGDSLSLADLLLAPQLDFFRETPEWVPLTEKAANLRAWLNRMNERPSMAATSWERVAAMAKLG